MSSWDWTITAKTRFCVTSGGHVAGPFRNAREAHRYRDACERNNSGVEWTVKVLHEPRKWSEIEGPEWI
jgi:hypothetical protein